MADKLTKVELAEAFNAHLSPEAQQEQQIAVFDLVEDNVFKPTGMVDRGPFRLNLNEHDGKLVFNVAPESGTAEPYFVLLSLTPFRQPLSDYFDICTAYNDAIQTASAARIESIDMARRGVHNDLANLLIERLEGKIDTDLNTARRLITLLFALYLGRREALK
ncbi:MAG: Uncharacterised protein [Rhodospirillaceae bacterium]|nr:UPF0262 family protein [Alphaproteobacteria bacterium]CAI8353083.1 MAG: Uncharacterised protein [Rhodospirillaceae bacterium]